MSLEKTNKYEWENGIPMSEKEIESVKLLRKAGCKCYLPLIGYINDLPRCRLCGVEYMQEDTK